MNTALLLMHFDNNNDRYYFDCFTYITALLHAKY